MNQENMIIGIVLLLCGAFSFWGAFKDYDWFLEHRKARFLVDLMGRPKARIFYMVLGALLMVGGVVGAAGGLGG